MLLITKYVSDYSSTDAMIEIRLY